MAHAPETGGINWLHLSVAGFWYVCHANLVPDSSGTRFRRQLEHCSIPCQKAAFTWLKWWLVKLWLVDDNYLRFNVFSCCNLITTYEFIVYVAFSHVYFRRQKFSYSRHVWYENPSPKTADRKWSRFIALIYGTCVMGIRLLHKEICWLHCWVFVAWVYLIKKNPIPHSISWVLTTAFCNKDLMWLKYVVFKTKCSYNDTRKDDGCYDNRSGYHDNGFLDNYRSYDTS